MRFEFLLFVTLSLLCEPNKLFYLLYSYCLQERLQESAVGCPPGDHLADDAVEVGVGRPGDLQLLAAQIVDGLVVHHESHVSVLQRGVREQDGVVRLHHRCRHLRREQDGVVRLHHRCRHLRREQDGVVRLHHRCRYSNCVGDEFIWFLHCRYQR